MSRVLYLIALLLSFAATAAPLPPHRAEYLLTRDGPPAAILVTELTLSPDGGYRYEMAMRPHPVLALIGRALAIDPDTRVMEQSQGAITAQGLRPEHYRYCRDNGFVRELTVTFDWAAGRAAMNSDDKPWSMAVADGTLDKLAVTLALRRDIAAGIERLSYPVADGGKLKTYSYLVRGRAEVTTPAGSWSGIELMRTKDGGGPDYRIWLAPDLSYLPIRVEREENGSLFHMNLTISTLLDTEYQP